MSVRNLLRDTGDFPSRAKRVATYIYASEIWPTNLRATGMATSIFIYFVQACIWSGVAPTAYATIGWKFYISKLNSIAR